MPKEAARAALTQLRRPIAATLEERRSRQRSPVEIVALAPDAVQFIADRSLPPGTECTIALRRVPPLEIDVTVEASAIHTRDLFASRASVRRVRASDRDRFAQLLGRSRSAAQ